MLNFDIPRLKISWTFQQKAVISDNNLPPWKLIILRKNTCEMWIKIWISKQMWNVGYYRYTPEIPDLLYRHVQWCCQPWGSNWGSLGFCRPHTQKHTQNKYAHVLSRAVQRFMRVYLHVRTAVDVGDIRTWRTTVILITWKTRRPPIWAPCRNKDSAGSGISGVYLR